MTLAFKGGDGAAHGAGALTVAPDGVLVRLDLTGLTPGWHAVHFHQKADCSDSKLMNSGGHVKAMGMVKPHGFLNAGASDDGDLPNVWAAPDGAAHAEFFTRTVSGRGEGGRTALMDADGSALIVHAAPDDYISQPLGGAGARVACALIAGG